MDKKIKISPIVRLYLSFSRDLKLDGAQIFNEKFVDRLIERYKEAEAKQASMIKSVLIFDGIMISILTGKSIKIPYIESIAIPGAMEICLILASFSFLFFCTSFVDLQGYSGMIDQISLRDAGDKKIDHELVSSSRKNYNFFLKLYRSKFNLCADDYYNPSAGFSIVASAINFLVLASVLILPTIHLLLCVLLGLKIAFSGDNYLIDSVVLLFSFLFNLTGLAIVALISKDFWFSIRD